MWFSTIDDAGAIVANQLSCIKTGAGRFEISTIRNTCWMPCTRNFPSILRPNSWHHAEKFKVFDLAGGNSNWRGLSVFASIGIGWLMARCAVAQWSILQQWAYLHMGSGNYPCCNLGTHACSHPCHHHRSPASYWAFHQVAAWHPTHCLGINVVAGEWEI